MPNDLDAVDHGFGALAVESPGRLLDQIRASALKGDRDYRPAVYGLRGDTPILYPNARIAICEQADAVGWANRCRTRRRSHKTKDWRSITRRRRLIVVEARRMGITNTAELSDASNCSRRSVVHSVGHHVGCTIGVLKKPGAGAGRTDRRIKSDFGLSLLARGLLAKFTEVRPIRPEPCAVVACFSTIAVCPGVLRSI